METVTRAFKPPSNSYFLFGPRGTGKSTLVREAYPDALYVDLLRPELFRTYSARPELLREKLLAEPERRTVIIDEVQRVPQLLGLVHGLIEENKRLQFVLTGSSARKLKRTGVDLLGGRALVCALHPFMATELGAAFRLGDALVRGLLPVILGANNSRRALEAYVALYLREEVQMEGLVRNIGNFSRFLEAVSFSHASPLNISNVARECEVERKVVEGYLGVLEDLLLGFRVEVFRRRAKRETSTHPKFYLFDSGVYQTLRPRGPLDRPDAIAGHALEGLVAQQLRAWIAYSSPRRELYYWRTRSGVEVDFVVYGEDGIHAIEVKNASRIDPQDLSPLRAFKEDYPESTTLLLYRGTERLRKGAILCLPCEEFLARLRPEQPLEHACR